jgi:Fur family ferric uptake transcriptional regulator
MAGQRRFIARVLSESEDHPDVELPYQLATAIDPKTSVADVYRTVHLSEEVSILERHDFDDGRSRYEKLLDQHHDHLIDIESSEVFECMNDEIEAQRLGYKLLDHKPELVAVPLDREEDAK